MNTRIQPALPAIDFQEPTCFDAEAAALGSILLGAHIALPIVASIIVPADFYLVHNRWIYEVCLALRERNIQIDFVTVTEELDRRGQLAEIGGPAYVSGLMGSTPTAYHSGGYARQIADASARRGMLRAASEIARMAYDADGDIDSKIGKSIAWLSDLHRVADETRGVSEVAAEVCEQIEAWYENPIPADGVRGLSCGLRGIDKMLGGFEPRVQYILAGRPGMGKSSLAYQIAFNLSRGGRRVAIFSLEMTRHQIVQRAMCGLSSVQRDELRRGTVPNDKWPDMIQAIAQLSALPLYINDSSRVNSGQIEREVSRLSPLDLVVIDHLHLVANNEAGDNDYQRTGIASWAFKRIAKDYNVPVLAVCQLNRGVESRDNKRPVLSDLRDSGKIEENADVVMMMYRDDYYNRSSDTPNIVEVWPRKLRDGDTDSMVELYFDRKHTRFGDAERRALGSL